MGLSAAIASDRRPRLPLQVFVLTVFLLSITSKAEIEVNTFGVRSATGKDTAMIFYVNVEHKGYEGSPNMAARLHMEKCCLNISSNETNCDAMKLISGLAERLRTRESRTLEMYFVNFDILDREGSCVLRLLSKRLESDHNTGSRGKREEASWERGREITIPFKTRLPVPTGMQKFLISMGWGSTGYKICSQENKNAVHECANHDCLLRYAGAMSIYNQDSKQCQTTIHCSNGTKQMLSKITGKCEMTRTELQDSEFLRSTYTEEMKAIEKPWFYRLISEPEPDAKPGRVKYIKTIKCEHGVPVKIGNKVNCSCHAGWRSLTHEEWVHQGGSLEPDGTAPIYTLCDIPTTEHRQRKILLISIAVIACLVPIVALLICMIRKQMEDNEKRLRRKSSEKSLTSTSSEEDHEHEPVSDHRHEAEKKKSERDPCGPGPTSFVKDEEDDAEKLIMEIANRREHRPKRIESKEDKHDDDSMPPPPPPPPPPPSPPSAAPSHDKRDDDQPPPPPTSSHGSAGNHTAEVSDTNSMIPQLPPSGPSRNPSASQLEPGGSKSSEKLEVVHLQRSSSSTGFDLSSDLFEDDEINMNYPYTTKPQVNMNMNYTSTRSVSTDELLTMRTIEKMGAHIPMQPVSASTSQSSIKSTRLEELDCCNNNSWLEKDSASKIHSFSSLSSEEITLRKKQQWDQFIESISKDSLPANKPSHHTIQVEEEENNNNPMSSCSNFSYFSKSPPPQFHPNTTAIKVRSLPEMQSSPSVALPIPPEKFIHKSLKEMPPEEYATRQEAYNILQSLSNSEIRTVYEEKSSDPIKACSTFPAITKCLDFQDVGKSLTTPSFEEIRLQSILEDVGTANEKENPGPIKDLIASIGLNSVENQVLTKVSRNPSLEEVRIQSIYGDMGSDADSEEALQVMEKKSTSVTRQSVAEQFKENQRQYQASLMQISQKQPEIFGSTKNNDFNKNVGNLMDSENIHSDSYPVTTPASLPVSSSSSSEGFYTVTEKSGKMTGWLQEYFYSREGAGLAHESSSDTKRSIDNFLKNTASESESLMAFETESAYGIKASLENVLKASKSRSATHHS